MSDIFADQQDAMNEIGRKEWNDTLFVSKDLCINIYGLSNFEWSVFDRIPDGDGGMYFHHYEGEELPQTVPAYTLGFLLRKIPSDVNSGVEWDAQLEIWSAYYDEENDMGRIVKTARAEKPEDAVAKLCVDLLMLGVIE